MLFKRLFVAMLIAITLSCVTVDSEANLTYKDRVITKTLNVAYFHKKRGLFGKEKKDFYDDFSTEFDRVLNSGYKLTSKTVVENSYKFDSFDINEEVNEYNPDTVIEIVQGDTIVDQYNMEVSTDYIIKIYDAISGGIIWQSEISDEFPTDFADSLAKKLVDIIVKHQREDGLNLFNESYGTGSVEISESSKEIINSGLEMVFVEAGSYERGDQEVTLTKDFYIGKYEVTQELYKEIMGNNPSRYKGENKPVDSVSWFNAIKFCNKLSLVNNKTPVYDIVGNDVRIIEGANGYRLPTDAEWEYASRGGRRSEGYKYSGSDKISDVAWYKGNSAKTHDVGIKKPNELGVYDMNGNVWEWCYDWYGSIKGTRVTDPVVEKKNKYKLIKGGSWWTKDQRNFKHSWFQGFEPDNAWDIHGFRVITYDLPMTEEDIESIKSLSTDSEIEQEAI